MTMARAMARTMARTIGSWAEKGQALLVWCWGDISIPRTEMTGRGNEEEKYNKRPEHRRASPWDPLREMTTFLLTSKGSSVLEKKIHSLVP